MQQPLPRSLSYPSSSTSMDDAPNPTPASAAAAQQQQQQQQQLLQRQLFLMQQQQQAQAHPTLQAQLSQQAMSRFPSNIDAHLRAPGLRFQPPTQHQAPSQPQPQQAAAAAAAAAARGRSPEVEMALQDAMRVCKPDIKMPFESVEDAVHRLLPYHVVADYEAEEDDRILDSDTTGQIPSRLQQWDHNILVKIAEFTTTFEKQVLAYNIMTRKRALGEFRSEERLMLEQALLQEEKHAMLETKAEIESREKAGREAVEAKMRMAMAEHARVEPQTHSDMIGRGPMRSSAAASQGEDGPSIDMVQEQGEDEWGNAQRDDEEPSEDFLNDENEPENGNSGMQEDWRGSGELDLNSR